MCVRGGGGGGLWAMAASLVQVGTTLCLEPAHRLLQRVDSALYCRLYPTGDGVVPVFASVFTLQGLPRPQFTPMTTAHYCSTSGLQ